MYLVNPQVQVWDQIDKFDHIARCARVCYASDKTTGNKEFYDKLVANEHLSMLRHATRYYYVPKGTDSYVSLCGRAGKYKHNPYVFIEINKNGLYMTANEQFVLEHKYFFDYFEDYELTKGKYILNFGSLRGVRITVCCVTQIATSREFNRVSPNNIAEQSTRYVNFGRKGGITICAPEAYNTEKRKFRKFLMRVGWTIDELRYNIRLKWGQKPQFARGVLPLETATKVVYTYTVEEWMKILDKRLRDKTGAAHPDAKVLAKLIQDAVRQSYAIIL